jgi:hypothetical protein
VIQVIIIWIWSLKDLEKQLLGIISPVTLLTTLPTVPVTLQTVPTLPPMSTTIFNPNCTFIKTFIGLDLYVIINILSPIANRQCTRFTHEPTKMEVPAFSTNPQTLRLQR